MAYVLAHPTLYSGFRPVADGVYRHCIECQYCMQCRYRHYIDPKLSPLPEPATADEELMVVEFRRWQLVGDHRMDRRYCELQIRHQSVRCIMVATWNLSTVSGANLKLYSLRCRSQEMLSGEHVRGQSLFPGDSYGTSRPLPSIKFMTELGSAKGR
ncbi:hypothetical protein MRX96_040470 [Rhipicephalus microplus]